MDPYDLDLGRIIDSKLEENGIGIDFQIRRETPVAGCPAFTIQFADGESVQGDGVSAEPKLI